LTHVASFWSFVGGNPRSSAFNSFIGFDSTLVPSVFDSETTTNTTTTTTTEEGKPARISRDSSSSRGSVASVSGEVVNDDDYFF